MSVAPSKAGETLVCQGCQGEVLVPKLGDLRQFPAAVSDESSASKTRSVEETSAFARAGFLVAGIVATACLLVASYCGLRWTLMPVINTTERHIATTREDMSSFSAAELIRAYEEMEKTSIDLILPYQYKEIEVRRSKWAKNAVYSGSAGLFAVFVAFAMARLGRKKA
ncbi:hypothetical protein OAE79_01595 [Rhodopirellula sp.]|nr:hypothetical protein [Rhodopirellula sp.]MDB4679008.1 hypothetical protein [Rhodopirellula sp.]